ncbi:heme biosynthesis HemY N-terminal domain-containing protein [Methylococcus capsulatus]|uniref:Putative hemY protein n=1 Tax=Methylococcus capsulatus (strain ATCC 33009 / NCIMB 11132 / Bath) TaxID=243233 RepID=Q602K1_METCA|nr:heme biosynthesis HemY N-terminal domain-containing protein [Methylococcus capsulatus]AAU90856.1 putative hemY protein [Methylococcus capsulatus str. Bath]QXP86536.1 heme biosynthesis protein HemY [Methylococcus capsulatus]QXP89245.1 heme biosynthesis protein HemY [Methylococcus capsulatus]QXP93794.1 heme biosynthesis protein HemY [Methylococcus capsulatus]UQN11484.1 heme biosynthesis protein HemY [Methylococcus capsulatus]
MRRLAIAAAILALVAGAAYYVYRHFLAQGDPGYVIIGYGPWTLESSLVVLAGALTLAFILFYASIRLVIHAMRLPKILRQRGGHRRNRQSQEALITGLIESAEGNWEKAEKTLIRHAADSGVPLINYLTAARAAHSRGAAEQRDEYLKLAHEAVPEAEIAIGLTRAELQLSDKQFDQALESLSQLNRIAPTHATVLRLLHQVYAQMEDWEGLRNLIPSLHTNKVMMEAEIKLLETETYSALLKQHAETRDAARLKALWENIPAHIRKATGIETLYFAAMIDAGAGPEIEPAVRASLDREWSQTVVVLYGCIQLPDPGEQLARAEQWLVRHSNDAVLLRVLGKLAVLARQTESALRYLDRSLALEPSVEACQLMGDLLLERNETAAACDCFRRGLLLASNEVIAQIDRNPRGESEPAGFDTETPD